MSAQPWVTFVVPCFNEEDNVGATVESARSAMPAGRDYEIILVDDCSKDRTLERMQELAQTDARIKGRVDQLIHGEVLAFYDLTKDHDERRNEIANPAYAAEIATMKQQLLGYMERTADPQLPNYRLALAGRPIDFKMERLVRKKGE